MARPYGVFWFFFFFLISHLQLKEVSFEKQGLSCQCKVSMKYDIYPLTF